MTAIKKLFEYIVLFVIGGMIYCSMEILYDGDTHWTMFICGGSALIGIGLLNEIIPWEMPVWLQMLCGCIFITGMELIVGLTFNRGHNLWDYSNIPLNYKGQICVVYSALWYVLSGFAIVLDDFIRYWLFHEDKPHYKLR